MSEEYTSYHLCVDVMGAIRSLGPNPRGQKYVQRKRYELELAKGRKVIPTVPLAECPQFDYQNGCPGHRHDQPRQIRGVE